MSANTLLLRLEGPFQAWGDHESKFVVRRTAEAPTKSGVMGLLCAALGVSRSAARKELPVLNTLAVGVRVDRPGVRWWDYHTVGADMKMRIAEGRDKTKPGAMLTRREYLCDASFLVALQGEEGLIRRAHAALLAPVWQLYLGRKCCIPSVPLVGRADESDVGTFPDLTAAISSVPIARRAERDTPPEEVEILTEWRSTPAQSDAPPEAEVWYDVATSFDVPGHQARFVLRDRLKVQTDGAVAPGGRAGRPLVSRVPLPPRPRADYGNSEYRARRQARLDADYCLCVFCKGPATTVQHVTYRRAGGKETMEDLRSLCRLCHDAVTMIEYGLGMGLDRINPEDPQYRDRIIEQRDAIVRHRSLEVRRRRMSPEDVE